MEVEENTELKIDAETLKNKLNQFSQKLENKMQFINKITRSCEDVSYSNFSDQYIEEYASRDLKYIQYSTAYFLRLYEIKEELLKQTKEKWRTYTICNNLLDIKGRVKYFFKREFRKRI
jgi:hypothetical protein